MNKFDNDGKDLMTEKWNHFVNHEAKGKQAKIELSEQDGYSKRLQLIESL